MIALAFTTTGALAGLAQAGLLWRAAANRDGVLGLALRFALVGVVLLGSILAGVLIPTAAGWGIGFATGVGIVLWRSRS